MTQLLSELSVLITRPSPQGDALCKTIHALGGCAIHFPTLAFAPPADQVALHTAIKALDQQDWLIFISPQAVYTSVQYIGKSAEGVKMAAMGAGTAKALNEAGYPVTVYLQQDANSEGLLDLAEFQTVSEKKIAIIRGAGGREKIDQILAQRGAIVLPVIVYQRVLPTVVNTTKIVDLLQNQQIHVMLCTSYESVVNLKILLEQAAWSYISDTPLLVISQRIKTLAEGLGFRRIWISQGTGQSAIVASLIKIKDVHYFTPS